MSATYSINNWEQYQHYKDRDPPWVKLYRDIFTTESWVMGTDLSRLVQVASVLLAARYKNKIPLKFDLLRRVSSLDCTESEFARALRHLEQTDFLAIQELADGDSHPKHDASGLLASCNTTSEVLYSEQSRAEQSDAGASRPRRASKKAPPDFHPDRDFALSEIPALDFDREVARFRDFEFKTPHKDWEATWRNWVRTAKDRGQFAKSVNGAEGDRWE